MQHKNANRNPQKPSTKAPINKLFLIPILTENEPEKGLKITAEKFTIPNTSPYSKGFAPLDSASVG